jgi:hypothetical protein
VVGSFLGVIAAAPHQFDISRSWRQARLRHPGLRISRPAADHAAKPHAGAVGHDRRGGVVAAGRLRQRITEDMSKSELLSPMAAAWIPVAIGSLTGFVALLYQEDG